MRFHTGRSDFEKAESSWRDSDEPTTNQMEAECGHIVADAANLPATIPYDAQGREVWRRLGGFELNAPEALRVIGEAG